MIITSLIIFGCNQQKDTSPTTNSNQTQINDNYLGSEYEGNYVWGGAMNLAWTELNENIIGEDLALQTTESAALTIVEKLNNPIFSTADLDSDSYYIKSGYGQKTVETINKESKEKFPTKSFSDIKLDLNDEDIISYAYFLKEVEYETQFATKKVKFNNEKVAGFFAEDEEQFDTVKVLNYTNDDQFIIKLKLKDEADELILAKGYDMNAPETIVKEINEYNRKYLPSLNSIDKFTAPNLELDHKHVYEELIGKYLANSGFESKFISAMFENIKFKMDNKGAHVENEAVIVMVESAEEPAAPPEPRNFFLDKPYWVIMKQADSQNPYFILGVNNTKLMEE